MDRMVLGVFSRRQNAELAISELDYAGYKSKDISIIMRDIEEGRKIADNTGSHVTSGAMTGAATGGIIGGLAGLLIGIGAISVPGLGALLIGGPIAAALGLTGAAAGAASGAVTGVLAGGLLGALVNLGIPEEDARIYEEKIRAGGILVAVPAQEGVEDEVREILEQNGADQIRMISPTVEPEDETDLGMYYRGKTSYDKPAYATGAKGGRSRRKGWFAESDEAPQKLRRKRM